MRTSVHAPHFSRRFSLAAPLAACTFGCLAGASASLPAFAAADTDSSQLQEVVVTGSLIPSTQQQTFTPVMTITNEDIQSKGFADVAEALAFRHRLLALATKAADATHAFPVTRRHSVT